MTRKIKTYLLASLTMCLMLFTFGVNVNAMSVVKSFKYDYNTVLGYNTNYHDYKYADIPDYALYIKQSKAKVGGGWNYARYQVIKYYGLNGVVMW